MLTQIRFHIAFTRSALTYGKIDQNYYLVKRAHIGHGGIKYTVRLRVILVKKYWRNVYQFHQIFQVSVYKYTKWVRTNVFEIKMHIVRQLGHIDKKTRCDS